MPTAHRRTAARSRRSPDPSTDVTSERIAHDLAAFRRNGGRIERLGTTRVLTRVDETNTDVPRKVAVPTRVRA